MSGEDRADRLRRRRQRTRDRAVTDESGESEGTGKDGQLDETAGADAEEREESVEGDKSDETAKPDETEKTDETEGNDEPQLSVKDEQKPTYMYLPHSVRRDLDRAYSIRKAEYEYEYEEPFEKNRHFYPLVVSLGLEAIDELDAEDVRSRLEDGL